MEFTETATDMKESEIQQVLTTHDASKCKGSHCCIHNPSDHSMRTWPLNWRDDKGVMERICPHGIGHPDPDDAAYNISIGREYLTVHGCDGCCDLNTKYTDSKSLV